MVLVRLFVNKSPIFSTVSIFISLTPWLTISSLKQIVLFTYYLLRRVKWGVKVLANTKSPTFYSWTETLTVAWHIGIPTALPSEVVMLIMVNNYLQQWYIANIYAFIVERTVLVCNFEIHKTEKSVNLMIKPVRLLTHAWSVWF